MEYSNRTEIESKDYFDDICVLIVDNDITHLKILHLYFKMARYKTYCAMNGKDALLLLKTGLFTLMITDYNMPGMNGLMLSKEAKKIVPELSIIMLTGEHLGKITSNAFESGILAVLPKPVDISKLLSSVHEENTRRRLKQDKSHGQGADIGSV